MSYQRTKPVRGCPQPESHGHAVMRAYTVHLHGSTFTAVTHLPAATLRADVRRRWPHATVEANA